jgi:hypothetical protein
MRIAQLPFLENRAQHNPVAAGIPYAGFPLWLFKRPQTS